MEARDYLKFKEEFVRRLWLDVAPFEKEIEDEGSIPRDHLFPVLRELGAFGLLIPEAYGGFGLTISQYVPLVAEFAKVHGGIRALVHVHNSFGHAYSELADEDDELLPLVSCGERSIAFALTEPDHGTGSDIGTSAASDGDEYVIHGRKWLITNADFASHFIVFARTSPDSPRAISAFILDRNANGLRIEGLPETMGCKGGFHGLLTFDGVRVGADAILGGEGRGLEHMERALEVSRILVAASSLGTAERAFELALDYGRERETFGRPIIERQAIQRYVAEMARDIYALRLMLKDAADRCDGGERVSTEAALLKLFALEAVGRVTDRALLTHGGIGYTRKHSIERLYRDARLNWLEEGTPTMQHLVAARRFASGYQWNDFWATPGTDPDAA